MRRLFLDSSYLIALEASDDQHHSDAQTHWKNLIEDLPHLLTTTWIFDEVLTFFNSRRKHAKAVEIGNNLLHSPSVTLI